MQRLLRSILMLSITGVIMKVRLSLPKKAIKMQTASQRPYQASFVALSITCVCHCVFVPEKECLLLSEKEIYE